MPVSRAKRTSNSIRKDDAEAFKQYAEDNNTTPNALLRNYIYSCLEKDVEQLEE